MRMFQLPFGVLLAAAITAGVVAGCGDPTGSTGAGDNGAAAKAAGPGPSTRSAVVAEAVDPNCHMTVHVDATTPHAAVGGRTYYFCSDDCRDEFLRGQARVVAPAVHPSTRP